MANNDTDALLKDLEARASSSKGKSSSADGGGEDIEAFLKSLEGDDYAAPAEPAKKPATKTKVADPLDSEFAALEAAPNAPLEKVAKPDKKAKKEDKKAEPKKGKEKSTDVAVVERGESDGLKNAARVAKWTVVLVPLLAAWWLLGAFLSSWVSAGWLVFLLSTVVVFGLPLGLLLALKRGRYVWWTAASSALVAVALVAPMPQSAAAALASYGHWPSSAIGEVAGFDQTSPFVRANVAVSSWFARMIHPTTEERPARKLGTETPLNPPETPTPDPSQPAPTQPAPTQPAPTQPAPTQPAPTQPAPTQPAPTQPAPTQPAPTQPAPTQPAPTRPAPTQPAPTQPAPTQPAPTQPAPTQPAPTQPAPTQPAPTQPAPTQPAPSDSPNP